MTYSPFRHLGSALFKHRAIQLTFFVTRKCNAACPYCFYLSTGNFSGTGANPTPPESSPELSIDEIEKISASLGPLLWLAFSGGEIFLRDDLADITKAFYKNNRPSIILLPTNGLMPDVIRKNTEKILSQCGESIVAVKLSIDGPEEIHDPLRGVNGALKRVMETHKALEPLLAKFPNFELGVNTVFCRANQDAMHKTIDLVKGLRGVSVHTVSLIRGSVSDESLKDVDMKKYLEAARELEKNLKSGLLGKYRFGGARLKAAQDIVQRRLIHETALKRKRLIDCCAGKLTLVLTESGDVYPCESFSRKMGNVREFGHDLNRLVESNEATGAVDSIAANGCWCTHECYFMMNILFNPRTYPALLNEYFRI